MPTLLAPPDRLAWSDWFPQFARDYRVSAGSADHVLIIGPTGTGKTTIAMEIASRLRRYVAVLATKPADPDLAALLARYGYQRQQGAGLAPTTRPRVAIWPPWHRTTHETEQAQRAVFREVLDTAFESGGWHLVLDEAPYLVDLGMRRQLTRHWRMGRSVASGLIACAQRPVDLPRYAMSGSQHLLIFGTNDADDLKRIGGLNGVSDRLVRETVAGLGRHYDFLHVDTRTGRCLVSRYEPS